VAGRLPSRGFLRQEQVDFDEFLANRFGRHYDCQVSTRFSNVAASGQEIEPSVAREPSL